MRKTKISQLFLLDSLELKLDINNEQNCDISKYLENKSWQNKNGMEGHKDFPIYKLTICKTLRKRSEKRVREMKWNEYV